jgi:hypothetical protein
MSEPALQLPQGGPTRPPPPTGLKILVWIGIAFLLFLIVVSGTCAYCVLKNPEARKIGAILGESVRMGLAATKAPGTAELREAGCDQAMVMDLHNFTTLVAEMDAKSGKSPTIQDWQSMVLCQIQLGSTRLTCEQVARIYGRAVPSAPAKFAVAIQVQLPRKEICQGLYGPDGTKLGDLSTHDNTLGKTHELPADAERDESAPPAEVDPDPAPDEE